MAQSKITLIGMEKYLNPDYSVFDNMVLPDGIDKEVLVGSIIMRCQEFELLFSDPDFMIAAVNIWSRKNYRTFDKWVKALELEYEPLYNYDRTEDYTDSHQGQHSDGGNNTRTDNLTQTNNLTTDSDHVTVTHSEKAYNESSFVETSKDDTDGPVTNTGTVKNTGTVGDVYSNSGATSYINTHKARLYGNIGVTTSQQMLQAELDIARWNMYEHIADLFCQEFCIMVY